MTLDTFVVLSIAGVAGGVINALAGGATLITFPVMLWAGLPPISANASNAVAISPGYLMAALADRQKLPSRSGRLYFLIAIAIGGGGIGATVLLVLPEQLFTLPVPALIAFATLLFAVAPQVQRFNSLNQSAHGSSRSFARAVLLGLASIYGGFFGAGLGVILTAAVSVSGPDDIRAIKALKNLLAACVAFSALAVFVDQGAVAWREAMPMLAGAVIGGYVGGHLVRTLRATYVRWFVIVAGVVMTAVYAIRYW